MQKAPETKLPLVVTHSQPLFSFRRLTLLVCAITLCTAFIYGSFTFVSRLPSRPTSSAVPQSIALNGASRWSGDSDITPPTYDFSLSGTSTQNIAVSPLFATYYVKHAGVSSLGNAVTVAFSTEQGWMQFFRFGALLLPSSPSQHRLSTSTDDPLAPLISSGFSDSSTGILRVPLLQALFTAGSQIPIGGESSSLTYADLRTASNPALLVPAPTTPLHSTRQDVFIQGGTRAGKPVGHMIPQPIWNALTRADFSPDGWQTDFGLPLTEALAVSITQNGQAHHFLVQSFWRNGLILDEDSLDASGHPLVAPLETGIDYLRTLGPPAVLVAAQQTLWTQRDTAMLTTPGTGLAVAHMEEYVPLTMLGDTRWTGETLWYHVQWGVPKQRQAGWVSAAATTTSSPGNMPGRAAIDALSSDLADYLSSVGPDVDTVVYDVTHKLYYSYNASSQFIMGSSMKVPIMLTFFDMIERKGREPTAHEMVLLTTMIENSNNDSASALYYGEIGGAAGVARYLQRIHITDLDPDPDAWGYSLVTPQAMVQLLTDLYEGSVLTAPHRQLAFYWMEHIETDQQVGVGNTAPSGTTVAMKDGWLPGPDTLWAMNSSGIVTQGQETYIIAVYTHEQPSLGKGQEIAQHVCRAVAQLLLQ